MKGGDRADQRRVAAEGMGAHGGQNARGLIGWHDRDQFALVRHIERVEAKQFAGAAHDFAHRDGRFVEFEPDLRLRGDFVQRAAQAAPCRVSHTADTGGRIQHVPHQGVQRGGIALHRSVEAEFLARRKDGDAVIADKTGKQNLVSGLCVARR